MIFKAILYYALAKGAWKGLKKRPRMTLEDFDRMLEEQYIRPLTTMLHMDTKFLLPEFDEIRVEAGSMR